jgi:hypothetical protein
VLLAWDKERRELVRKIESLRVPMLVLVVVEAGAGIPSFNGSDPDRPERFFVLECGKIEQGLAQIK